MILMVVICLRGSNPGHNSKSLGLRELSQRVLLVLDTAQEIVARVRIDIVLLRVGFSQRILSYHYNLALIVAAYFDRQ